MRSSPLRILLLAIFGLWFGVIVPGHERGVITVPGFMPACHEASCEESAGFAEATPMPACGGCPIEARAKAKECREKESREKDSKRQRAQHCAVCQSVGVLGAPVVILFAPPTVELIGCLPLPAYQSVTGIDSADLTRSRGPPVFSCAA